MDYELKCCYDEIQSKKGLWKAKERDKSQKQGKAVRPNEQTNIQPHTSEEHIIVFVVVLLVLFMLD